MKTSKNTIILLIVLLLIILGIGYVVKFARENYKNIEPIPIETVDNTPETPVDTHADLIVVDFPKPNDKITSPLTITGKARGYWYFEASFPVELYDANNVLVPLTPGYIMATGDWMTTDFVPFSATLTFTPPATPTGTLVLKKDNPSGDPAKDDSISIPVKF